MRQTTKEHKIANTSQMRRSRRLLSPIRKQPKYYNIGRSFQETATSLCGIFNMIHICTYCNAKLFLTETQEMCCKSGKIKLASAGDIAALRNLFIRNDYIEKDFRKNIRAYNSIFAFTSMGIKLDNKLANDNVRSLWNISFTAMSEDFARCGIPDGYPRINAVLQHLKYLLEQHHKSLNDYDLPLLTIFQMNYREL
ncbi:6227_t:CDS:2 [Gigaspora margarita]|uniref:6227_t:CDS:1 n=1 Tax=Gigaspora margarita TaxID=4874 RepID=A0ABM8VYU6_GIGMA|nr:6227_t:CDS:2 [Gigaspora margarita]